MADFYEANALYNGVFRGRALVQAEGKIGGMRNVFVKFQGLKDFFVKPPHGGIIKNPFKGHAKAYAGDLCEFRAEGNEVYILKTYEVSVAAGASDTTVKIVRNGFRHIPFVGDVLMKAPTTITGTGKAVTVTAVVANGDVWDVTLSEALGALTKGEVLVEGASAGASVKAMVTNPNAFFDCDCDFLYDPASADDIASGARYLYAPSLANESVKMYANKMQPLPASVKKLNKSLVDGWFNL